MASPLDSVFAVFSTTLNFLSSVSVSAVRALQGLKGLLVEFAKVVDSLKNIPGLGFFLNIILTPLSLIISSLSSLIDGIILVLNLVVPAVKQVVDSYPTSLFIIIGALGLWIFILYPELRKLQKNGFFRMAQNFITTAFTRGISSIGFGFQALQNSFK